MPKPQSPLWQFGCSSIGYDSTTSKEVPLAVVPGVTQSNIREATAEPRRYGFHATLKSPFSLAEGQNEKALESAALAFAANQKSFEVPALQVAALGRFLAIVTESPSEGAATPISSANVALGQLAAACVKNFDPFRADLSDADRQRRLSRPLTERQRDYLDTWGYPYVLDEFRFHMTLTGPLPEPQRALILSALQHRFGPIKAPLTVDAIALCRQPDRSAKFRVMQRYPFAP